MRVRSEHWELLLSFCTRNPELITNRFTAPDGKVKLNVLWQSTTAKLNSLGFGEKSVDGWRKTLTDWKSKTKSKASALRKEQQQTGGGPPQLPPLSSLEEKLLDLMGTKAITGDEVVPELGFGKVIIPKHANVEDPNMSEIAISESYQQPSTSYADHDYGPLAFSENFNTSSNAKRKLEASSQMDSLKSKKVKRPSRPSDIRLSNELLNVNRDTLQLLNSISNNTENISTSLQNISTSLQNISGNTESIVKSLSDIATVLKNNVLK